MLTTLVRSIINILNKLIQLITKRKAVVWGIRVPQSAKKKWQWMATLMGVPANRLVLYVLNDWVQQNAALLMDREARSELAARIAAGDGPLTTRSLFIHRRRNSDLQ